MLAGGTGVTPMYQVAQAILKDAQDTTQLVLIFGNLTEEDILLREELEAMADAHPQRFKVGVQVGQGLQRARARCGAWGRAGVSLWEED